MEVTSRSVNDESALFDDDNEDDEQIVVNRTSPAQKETSKQRLVSMAKLKPEFEGLRMTTVGHRIQEVKELMTVPVRTFNWVCGLKDRLTDSVWAGHRDGGPDEEPTSDQSICCEPVCEGECDWEQVIAFGIGCYVPLWNAFVMLAKVIGTLDLFLLTSYLPGLLPWPCTSVSERARGVPDVRTYVRVRPKKLDLAFPPTVTWMMPSEDAGSAPGASKRKRVEDVVDGSNGAPRKKTRTRVSYSCSECHRRKQKVSLRPLAANFLC